MTAKSKRLENLGIHLILFSITFGFWFYMWVRIMDIGILNVDGFNIFTFGTFTSILLWWTVYIKRLKLLRG